MKVALNFTGREKLLEGEVAASLQSFADQRTVAVKWNLALRELPSNSYIAVSISGRGENVRTEIPCESVGQTSIDVSRLRDLNGLSLDFFVVTRNAANLPIIRFSLTDISVENDLDPGKKKSMLPIISRLDLGVPWTMDVEEGIGPALIVRSNDGLASELLASPIFLPLVLPSAVSFIYTWLQGDETEGFDDKTIEAWKKFMTQLGVMSPSASAQDGDEREAEIRSNAILAAQAFSDRFSIIEQIQMILVGVDSE